MRRIKQHSKPQSDQIESTTLNKPTRTQKGPPVVASSSNSGHAVKQKASQPQRASLRKQQFGGEDAVVGSGAEMPKVDAVNANFSLGDGGMSYDEQETGIENDSKRNRKTSQKQIQDEPHSMPLDNSSLRRSSRLNSRAQYSTDSNSSFASPDPPKRQRGKGSTDHKQLTKPHKIETSVPQDSTSHKEQNEQGSRIPKKVLQRNSDDVLAGDSIDFPTDDDEYKERQQHDKKATLLLKRTRQRKGRSELKINGHLVSSEDMHSEHSEVEESVQHAASNNRRSKKSETGKANTRSKKPQTENSNTNKQDELLDGKWTEEELQKLHE